MNYPLFNDIVVIVVYNEQQSFKHLPNNKYNISEDLCLKIKEIFSGKKCNIIFGGTINEQNTIGFFGTEKFKQQSAIDGFFKYLIDYSNWDKLIKEIQKDLSNGITTYSEENRTLKFVPNEYDLYGKISQIDKDIVFNTLRKYQDIIGFEIKDKQQYIEIIIYPVLKQHRILSENKKSEIKKDNKLSEEQIRKLIINNCSEQIKKYFNGIIAAINKDRKSDNIFYISLEPIDLDWEIDNAWAQDFQLQYGYAPEDNFYYTYDSRKFDNLTSLIENILGPLGFSIKNWEVSTEYKYVEFEIEYDKI